MDHLENIPINKEITTGYHTAELDSIFSKDPPALPVYYTENNPSTRTLCFNKMKSDANNTYCTFLSY